MFNQEIAFVVTNLGNSLMMTTPQREREDVMRVRRAGEEEIDEEMPDFGDGQGDERLRLSLKALRDEFV